MAHKKAGGSTKNGRKSKPKYLGIKKFGGEFIKKGSIIIKQNGTKYRPGINVLCGRNYTLFAKSEGKIHFYKKGKKRKNYVSIIKSKK